jgi:predicted Zn-dependent protease
LFLTADCLALARHDTADAMRRLRVLSDTLCDGACPLDAITYAELLTAHGQAAAADSLLNRRYGAVYLSLSELLRELALARAADRAGDRRTEREAYAYIEDMWATADPELQPAVAEARAALARLAGDAR